MRSTHVGHSVLDELFETADDEQVFFLIVITFVACVKPTVLYRFCSCLCIERGDKTVIS